MKFDFQIFFKFNHPESDTITNSNMNMISWDDSYVYHCIQFIIFFLLIFIPLSMTFYFIPKLMTYFLSYPGAGMSLQTYNIQLYYPTIKSIRE